MGDPSKHHYLPVFYTKRWAGPSDGKLVEFRKWPASGVRPKRRHPAGTGWKKDLYAFNGLPDGVRQEIETKYLKRVDTQASNVLARLEVDGGRGSWKAEERQAWVTFLRTMLMRLPADIEALKRGYRDRLLRFTPEEEERYLQAKGPNDPEAAAEFFSQRSAVSIENRALLLMPRITEGREVGEMLMNWHWFVVDADLSDHELLTSDRPVRTSALKLDDAYMKLPIGPRKMFWAVRYPRWEDHLRRNQPRHWVAKQNLETVRGANDLVIGRTDISLPFVRRHMAAEPVRSLYDVQRQKRDELLKRAERRGDVDIRSG